MNKKRVMTFISSIPEVRKILTDQQALLVLGFFTTWEPSIPYFINDRVVYENKLYRVLLSHISQELWNPIAATSLFTEILSL